MERIEKDVPHAAEVEAGWGEEVGAPARVFEISPVDAHTSRTSGRMGDVSVAIINVRLLRTTRQVTIVSFLRAKKNNKCSMPSHLITFDTH